MRAARLSILLLWSSACAATTPAQIKKLSARGETDRMLAAYASADTEAVRLAVLESLADHPEEQKGRALVLRELADANSETLRLAAARTARVYSGPESARGLIQALGDRWPTVREVALSSIQSLRPAPVDALLEALSRDPNHLVRASAARLISGATGAELTPVIRAAIEEALMERALKDDAPGPREAAVAALGDLGVARARETLVDRMRADPDPGVRMAAERAIEKLGHAGESSAVIAVLPFKNDTGLVDPEVDRLGHQIADYLAARLSAAKVCQVVDASKTARAIAELQKTGAALYDGDAPNAPELGKFKIANQLVFGSVQRQGLVFTIVVNRMDIATLGLVPGAAVTVKGYRADLERLKSELADQLLERFR